MLQAGPPFLHYYCAVVLHSCIVLPPVGHSSNHEYHCCQLTRQSSRVSNFYRTFKFFIWLYRVQGALRRHWSNRKYNASKFRFSTREIILPKIVHNLCTRSQTCPPASSRLKNFKEYRFEEAQNEQPARSAHTSRAGPDTVNIENKPICDVTSFFIPRENQIWISSIRIVLSACWI